MGIEGTAGLSTAGAGGSSRVAVCVGAASTSAAGWDFGWPLETGGCSAGAAARSSGALSVSTAAGAADASRP
jgi:hypothetical protein